MRDEPSGAALLDIAHRTLMSDIAPTLQGRERYLAAMVGNAVRIVARELERADRLRAVTDGNSSLVEAIRSGRHDADPVLYERLRRSAILAVDISKPGALLPDERAALGSGEQVDG